MYEVKYSFITERAEPSWASFTSKGELMILNEFVGLETSGSQLPNHAYTPSTAVQCLVVFELTISKSDAVIHSTTT